MNLKVITTAALLVLGSASTAANLFAADGATPPPPPPPPAHGQGQGPGGPGGPGGGRGMNLEGRIKMMTETLGITEAQKAKLSPIIAAEIKEMQDLRQDESLDRKAKGEKMKAIREAYKPKIRAELTPEQVAKLEAWEKDHPMGGPRGERGERKGGDKQK
jgi:Spy/CpxP family protein refolding chaperone